MPASVFHLYDAIYARREPEGEGFLIAQPTRDAVVRLEHLAATLGRELRPHPTGGLIGSLTPSVSRAVHLRRIHDVLGLIGEGEVYQVNLTYPLVGRHRGAPEASFGRLVACAPPFAAFLRIDEDASVISASPECFFDLDAETRRIEVFPIKGTRPRSDDPSRDAQLIEDLRGDDKERAEHFMIVDLLRNDLGSIAEIGSVEVDRLGYVESFPRVHHLTSRISARLPAEAGLEHAFVRLFPGGSITGAPKLRAMEIIDALEDAPRGVYTGAIGYVTPEGSARTSIAIRTAQIARGEIRFGVGGGIVADSIPDREWEETEIKARALTEALTG